MDTKDESQAYLDFLSDEVSLGSILHFVVRPGQAGSTSMSIAISGSTRLLTGIEYRRTSSPRPRLMSIRKKSSARIACS